VFKNTIEQTSNRRQANFEQTSSKHRVNIELAQAGLLEPCPWLKCRHRLRLSPRTADHVLYRPIIPLCLPITTRPA